MGIGDWGLVPVNHDERIFALLLLSAGVVAFSWIISSFSNLLIDKDYNIQDIENLNKYKKRLRTLNELKLEYEMLSTNLYKRIEKFFQYKYSRETYTTSEFFKSLPTILRTNLLFEMYKDIINNFVFFKKTTNKDFINDVLISLHPSIFYKGEIIQNEGELVEEIFFVKRGRLIVEIRLENDSENEETNTKSISTCRTNSLREIKFKFRGSIVQTLNPINSSNKGSFIGNKFLKLKKQIKRRYIKLIEIRNNEHFGDVFLNRRSPITLKVSSKIAELFLLNQVNANEIANKYKDIWRKILSRSLHNMNQIKIQIEKINNENLHENNQYFSSNNI